MKLTHKEKYLLMEILVFINDFDPIITTPKQTEIVHINT